MSPFFTWLEGNEVIKLVCNCTMLFLISEVVPRSTVDGWCVWENVISSAGYVRTSSLRTVMLSRCLACFRGTVIICLSTMWMQHTFVWDFNVFGHTVKSQFDQYNKVVILTCSYVDYGVFLKSILNIGFDWTYDD